MVAAFPCAATFTLIHAAKARQHPTNVTPSFTIHTVIPFSALARNWAPWFGAKSKPGLLGRFSVERAPDYQPAIHDKRTLNRQGSTHR